MPNLPIYQPQVQYQQAAPSPEDVGALEGQAEQGFGNAVADFGQLVNEIQSRQRERYERLSRVSATERAKNSLMSEMNRLRVEDDITAPETLDTFKNNAAAIIDQEIESHNGSPDSKALLMENLAQIRGNMSLQFMKEQTSAQISQANRTITDKTGEYTELLFDRPDALPDTLVEMDRFVDKTIGKDIPSHHLDILKREKRTQLVSAAYNSILYMPPSREKLDALKGIIKGDIPETIDPDVYSSMRIGWYKAQAEYDREMARVQSLGNNEERFKKNNMLNFVHTHADDYASGNLSPFNARLFESYSELLFGFQERRDPVTNQIMEYRDTQPTEMVANALRARGRFNLLERKPKEKIDPSLRTGTQDLLGLPKNKKSLYERAIAQEGPAKALKRGAESFWLTSNLVSGEEDLATYNEITKLGKQFVTAMQVNPNYAVYEMKQLKQMFPLDPKWFGSESAKKEQLDSIERWARVAQARAFDTYTKEDNPQNIKDGAFKAWQDIITFRSDLGAPGSNEALPGSKEEQYYEKKAKQAQSSKSGTIQMPAGVANQLFQQETMQNLNNMNYEEP